LLDLLLYSSATWNGDRVPTRELELDFFLGRKPRTQKSRGDGSWIALVSSNPSLSNGWAPWQALRNLECPSSLELDSWQ